jgi:hypothetical protein
MERKIEKKLKKRLEKLGKKHAGTEDSTLKRTTGDAAQEKFRITFEARHIVGNYLGEGEPWEKNWRGALVVKGVHARLSNISDERTWIEDEEFEYAGKTYKRYAGKSAGRILATYVQLRKEHPEWFEDLEVYSQEAAVVDSVIMKWMLEAQAKEFPCSIWCRDMLAAGQTVQTRLVQGLAQQIGCRIYGGVTCIVQLTDTDYSWSFKSGVCRAQDELRREMKTAAAALGEVPKFKCGPREIVKLIYEGMKIQKMRHEVKPWILPACRRNGILHWRPDLLQGKMVKAEDQKWALQLPEGCFRYPSRWLEERSSWLKDGRPQRSSLEDIEDAEKFAKMLEADFCKEEGYYQVVKSMEKKVKFLEHHVEIGADEVQHDEVGELGANAEDLMPPKLRRKMKKAAEELKARLQEAKKKKEKQERKQKKWSKMQVFMKKGKAKLKEMLKTMTRAEAIAAMKPVAGKSKKSASAKVKEQKQCKKLKLSMMKSLKKKLKVKKASEADAAKKETPLKKKKKNLKTKPSAKKKHSLKTKPSAVKKAVTKDVMKEKVKQKKKDMKKSMVGYEGSFWRNLKKSLKEKPWSSTWQDLQKLQKLATAAEDEAAEEKQVQDAVEQAAYVELQLEGTKVVVVGESAGKKHFGRRAVIKKVEGTEALLDFDLKGVDRVQLEALAPESDYGDLNKLKKFKGFNAVTRPELRKILRFSGYQAPGECEGDLVQEEVKEGKMIYSMNLAAGFKLMQMSLDISDEDLELVHPDLFKAYMEGRKGPDPEASAADVEEVRQAQEKRRELLKKKLAMKKVVGLPVHYKNHWTTVVVDGRGEEPDLIYFDSLGSEDFVLEVWNYVEEGLQALMQWKLPLRFNEESRQPIGSSVCGAFSLHYLEQSCRTLILKEPWSSLGWPGSEVWGERVWKLANALKREQDKLKAELEKQEEKEKKLQEKEKKKAENKKKAGAVDEKVKELAGEADAALKKIPEGKPCLENLSQQAQQAVALAATYAGICSRCRWSAGCLSCSQEKALKYWLKREGFIVETQPLKAMES